MGTILYVNISLKLEYFECFERSAILCKSMFTHLLLVEYMSSNTGKYFQIQVNILVLVWSWIAWTCFLFSALLRLVEVGRQSQNSSFSCVTTNFLSAFCPTLSRRTTTLSRRTTTRIPMVANIWNNWDWFNFLWFLFLETSWHLAPLQSCFCLSFYLIVQLSGLQGLLSSPLTFTDVMSQDKMPWVNSFSSSPPSANIRPIKVNWVNVFLCSRGIHTVWHLRHLII